MLRKTTYQNIIGSERFNAQDIQVIVDTVANRSSLLGFDDKRFSRLKLWVFKNSNIGVSENDL